MRSIAHAPVETQAFQASGYEFAEALRQLAIAQAKAEDVESVYTIMQQMYAVRAMISRIERRFPGRA